MTQVNVDTVIEGYVKLRDKRAQLKKEFTVKDEELKAKMEKIESFLLVKMQSSGATQLGSSHGTAYQQTKLKGSCSDWGTYWGWLAEHPDHLDMLEKRISIKSLQTYYEDTGELPPGVNIAQELKVVVRRS